MHSVASGVATFLLTCELTAGAIIAQLRRFRANTIQLVDEVEAGARAELRESLPGISIVQVIRGASFTGSGLALAPL